MRRNLSSRRYGSMTVALSLIAAAEMATAAETIKLAPVPADVKAITMGRDPMITPAVNILTSPTANTPSAEAFQLGDDVRITSLTLNDKTIWIGASADSDGRKRYAALIENGPVKVKDGAGAAWLREFTSFDLGTEITGTTAPLYVRATGNPPVALRYFIPVYYEGTWQPKGGQAMKIAALDAGKNDKHVLPKLLLDLDDDGSYRFRSPTMEVRKFDEPFRINGEDYRITAKAKDELLVEPSDVAGPELAVMRLGAPAPMWEAEDMDGKPVKLSDFRGKFVFFDVWATWCGPCIGEIPNIQKAQEEFGDKVTIIGISIDGDKALPEKMAKDKKLTYHQLWAPGEFQSAICQQYQINGIPSTFLVDPDGKLVLTGIRGEQIGKALEMAAKYETAEAKEYFAAATDMARTIQQVRSLMETGNKSAATLLLKALKSRTKDEASLKMIDRYLEAVTN